MAIAKSHPICHMAIIMAIAKSHPICHMAIIMAIAKSHPICHMAIIMAIMFIFLCFVFLKFSLFFFFFCFTINWKKTYKRYQIYSLLILIKKVFGFQAFSFFFKPFQMLANRTSLSKKPLALKMSTLKKPWQLKG